MFHLRDQLMMSLGIRACHFHDYLKPKFYHISPNVPADLRTKLPYIFAKSIVATFRTQSDWKNLRIERPAIYKTL